MNVTLSTSVRAVTQSCKLAMLVCNLFCSLGQHDSWLSTEQWIWCGERRRERCLRGEGRGGAQMKKGGRQGARGGPEGVDCHPGRRCGLPSVQRLTQPPPAAGAPSCACCASSSASWTPQQLPEQLPWVETWRSRLRSQQLLAQVLLSWQLPFPSRPVTTKLCFQ